MIVQAITTRYSGPTNTRGARINARAWAGRCSVAYDHRLNPEQNHAAAAKKLAERFGWTGHYIQGGMPEGHGYCFVSATHADAGDGFTIGPDV